MSGAELGARHSTGTQKIFAEQIHKKMHTPAREAHGVGGIPAQIGKGEAQGHLGASVS